MSDQIVFGINGSNDNISDFNGCFNNLRVTNPQRKFSSKHVGNLNRQYQYSTSGSSTIVYNEVTSAADFNVPAGDKAFMQSTEYVIYQSGRVQEYMFTGVLNDSTLANGCVSKYGVFDDNADKIPYSTQDRGGDGHFFMYDSTGLHVVERKTTGILPYQSDTIVDQVDFNKDKLDGTGDSGVTFSSDQSYIFVIRLAWLGVGEVELGIYAGCNKYYPVHRFTRTNLTSTYMKRASLPIRFEIDNTLGLLTATGRQICAAADSLGGFTPYRRVYSYNRSYSQPNGPFHAFSIRNKPSHNRDHIIPYSVTYSASSFNTSEVVEVKVLVNATPSSSLTWAASPYGGDVEISTNNVTFTGGATYLSRYLAGWSSSRIQRPDGEIVTPITSTIDGTPWVLTFITEEVSGSVGTAFITFAFEQLN